MKLKIGLITLLSVFALSSCDLFGKKPVDDPTPVGCKHVDNNKDHTCDLCNEYLGDHEDNNKDHKCDVCGVKLTSCRDLNADHLCDVCNVRLSECIDEDLNHKCDVCYKVLTECSDANKDHYCDMCQKKISEHIDSNNDNLCDICGIQLSSGEEGDEGDELNAPVPKKLDYRAGYENNKSVTKPTSGTGTIDLYGINDFHGAIKPNYNEVGLAKMGSYMKSKTSQPNTLFIDSGDSWQGSLESNYNHGNLINDVFSYARLSARTIGNHDFDWGSRKLLENTERIYDGYNIPTLGANIYNFDWDYKTVGDTQMYNLGREYVTYTLDNGIKVGIVGVIGSDQITSICTNCAKNVIFTDHIAKIKEVSDFLRTEKKCDVIVASEHDGYSSEENDLTSKSPVSGKKYVDFVFNGHTHYNEDFEYNGVTFAQCGANGDAVGHATLTYNFATNEVTNTIYSVDNVSAINAVPTNSEIQKIVDKYAEETDAIGSIVLTNKMDGYFSKKEHLVNLMCEAIYFECLKEGINVDFTYANDARGYFSTYLGEDITYSKLYDAFPFDNTVYIIEVQGRKCMNELIQWNCVYNTGYEYVSQYDTYTVAALDYLAFHTNEYREYDYFPGAVEVDYLKDSDGNIYTYREILADYLLANPNKEFYDYDYSSSNDRFSKPTLSY
ncbi:MAG: hypothetical protein MJ236_04875 [Clostridia bacterium]|nr:hypothetical protein [Clostridia bacterium]